MNEELVYEIPALCVYVCACVPILPFGQLDQYLCSLVLLL
jgi:hypothetical protein